LPKATQLSSNGNDIAAFCVASIKAGTAVREHIEKWLHIIQSKHKNVTLAVNVFLCCKLIPSFLRQRCERHRAFIDWRLRSQESDCSL